MFLKGVHSVKKLSWFIFVAFLTPLTLSAQQTINCPGGLEDALTNRRSVRFVKNQIETNVYRITPIWSVSNCFMSMYKRNMIPKFEGHRVQPKLNRDGSWTVDINNSLNDTIIFEYQFGYQTELEPGAPHPTNGTDLKPTQLRYTPKFENEFIYGNFNQVTKVIGIFSEVTFSLKKSTGPVVTPTSQPTSTPPRPIATPKVDPAPNPTPKAPPLNSEGGTNTGTLMNLLIQLLTQLMQAIGSLSSDSQEVTRSITAPAMYSGEDMLTTLTMATELIKANRKEFKNSEQHKTVPRLIRRFSKTYKRSTRAKRMKRKARLERRASRLFDKIVDKITK